VSISDTSSLAIQLPSPLAGLLSFAILVLKIQGPEVIRAVIQSSEQTEGAAL